METMRAAARRRTAALLPSIRARTGFTLIELIVMMVILLTLVVVVTPTAMRAIDRQRITETSDKLNALTLSIYNTAANNLAFRQRVGSTPGRLIQLVEVPGKSDAINHPDACGGSFNSTEIDNWNSWGPFLNYPIEPTVGIPTPIGNGKNALIRTDTKGVITLAVQFPNVDVQDAINLDQYTDNANGSAAGLVQWTAPAGGITTLSWVMTVDGVC
jgi:type II secretory pathway pseudopilin PulG